MERPFQIGDMVRVARIPAHIGIDYPHQEVRRAFEDALGRAYRVSGVDWGGWVWLELGDDHGGIGVQPDCVDLVDATRNSDPPPAV